MALCFDNGSILFILTSQVLLYEQWSCARLFSTLQRCSTRLPLSGLLFVLVIEALAQAIRDNENIHGLEINDTELKLNMYADDLTAFIKDERSASPLFSLFNDFGTCSSPENQFLENRRNMAWKPKMPPFNIAWPEQYVFALAVAFAHDSTTSFQINFEEKLKNILNLWTTRDFNSHTENLHCQDTRNF